MNRRDPVKSIVKFAIAGVITTISVLTLTGQTPRDGVVSQERKPVYIYRFYTGPDNLSHVEKVEAKFTQNPGDVFKMMAVKGAELHRGKPGRSLDWHPGPRRQYVVDLTGHKEIEVAGGVKVRIGTRRH